VAPLAFASLAVGSCVGQALLDGSIRIRMSVRPICPGPVPNAVSTCAGVRSAIQPAPLCPRTRGSPGRSCPGRWRPSGPWPGHREHRERRAQQGPSRSCRTAFQHAVLFSS
jgi:hypothetical protein